MQIYFTNYQIHFTTLRIPTTSMWNANGQWESQGSLKTSLFKDLPLPNLPLFISLAYLLIVNPFATLRCTTWGCIISTKGPPLLDHRTSLYPIILVEIVLCFEAIYSGIGYITWSYFILYFLRLIYRHHFLLYLAFFYFLYSILFCFLTHVVSPIRLKLHVTQEVPLPPYFFNRS